MKQQKLISFSAFAIILAAFIVSNKIHFPAKNNRNGLVLENVEALSQAEGVLDSTHYAYKRIVTQTDWVIAPSIPPLYAGSCTMLRN